jgi:hypothetical protein
LFNGADPIGDLSGGAFEENLDLVSDLVFVGLFKKADTIFEGGGDGETIDDGPCSGFA